MDRFGLGLWQEFMRLLDNLETVRLPGMRLAHGRHRRCPAWGYAGQTVALLQRNIVGFLASGRLHTAEAAAVVLEDM